MRYWFYVKFNRLYFKIQGAEIGSNFSAYNHIDLFVNQNAKLKIGNDFLFISGESYNPLSRNIRGCMCLNSNASLVIGNNVGISSACIWVHKSIIIGNNVKIGGDWGMEVLWITLANEYHTHLQCSEDVENAIRYCRGKKYLMPIEETSNKEDRKNNDSNNMVMYVINTEYKY